MQVYIKNIEGQQTVRELPIWQALKLRLYCFARYRKADRPIVRYLI